VLFSVQDEQIYTTGAIFRPHPNFNPALTLTLLNPNPNPNNPNHNHTEDRK